MTEQTNTPSATKSDETAPESRTFLVDPEHTGVRLALPMLVFAGLIVGYFVASVILSLINPDVSAGCFPLIGAILFAVFITTVGDTFLKRIWPSGRTLTLTDHSLDLNDHRRGKDKVISIQLDNRINPLTWRFKVSRGSARVQKGSVMLGLKLMQDESEVTIYAFMPEKEATALPNYAQFTPLVSRIELESDKLPLREKGEQKRLLKAEQERWEDGAELLRQDFPLIIEALIPHISDWQLRS
jgi:hypothetical protein